MLETIDIAIVALYAGALVVLAHWVSREKKGAEKNPTKPNLGSMAANGEPNEPKWLPNGSLKGSRKQRIKIRF